jgi:hypothetical protein
MVSNAGWVLGGLVVVHKQYVHGLADADDFADE